MADVTTNKKLVDLDLLKYYDTKAKAWTKAEDATNLTAAKSYTDTEIGKVNDAATALTERVTAVEGKASANETAIGVLNGDVNTAGSVKKTVADEVAKIVQAHLKTLIRSKKFPIGFLVMLMMLLQ